MKTDKRFLALSQLQSSSPPPLYDFQQHKPQFNFTPSTQWAGQAGVGTRAHHRQPPSQRRSSLLSDRESVCSGGGVSAIGRGKRARGSRNISMKAACNATAYSKGVTKKSRSMDYTNYAYNEAVGRLKLMLADSYATPKMGGASSSYLRNNNFTEDSDNFSDNLSAIERPVLSDISKYLSPSQKSRITAYRPPKKPLGVAYSSSKENLAGHYPTSMAGLGNNLGASAGGGGGAGGGGAPQGLDYYGMAPSMKPLLAAGATADSVQAPVEIFNFIEKQEDYIEQLEKESKYCRNELTNLLGKVKDVISENEQLTENARSELAGYGGGGGGGGGGSSKLDKLALTTSPSSDSEELQLYMGGKKKGTPRSRSKDSHGQQLVRSPRYASAPNIVYEARISELEAELTQAHIDLKRVRTENDELKRKLANADPLLAITGTGPGSLAIGINCETHRKQIEHLQSDKCALEDTIRHLQKSLDDAKSQQYGATTKRYMSDLLQMERSQAELEVKHLRDELDRQHERVRELQHEMARRLADERSNAERRYNTQVDQLGGDLSQQWDQMAKLQLDVERQKRYETDLKRDLANRNSQIEELKSELRSNRSTFLADMAQVNAEKQSFEQEINALRLQLDRAAREAKTETARFNAEISSLRQRLDRGDADLLHSKREVLRLNDEIANLEKELAYGELKNEIRPTKKDLDKRMNEMQEKHAGTVNELEDMIQSQKQLMDKLTGECKTLTNKLEDTTLKHNQDRLHLRETNAKLMERLKQLWASYKDLDTRRGSLSHGKWPRSLRSRRIATGATSYSDTDSPSEEHFSQRPISLLADKKISSLQSNVEYLTNRMINNDRLGKIDSTPTSYNSLPPVKASTYDYKPSSASSYGGIGGGGDTGRSSALDDYIKSSPYSYDSVLGKSANGGDTLGSTAGAAATSGSHSQPTGAASSTTASALSPTGGAGGGGGGTTTSAYDGGQRSSAGLYDPVGSSSSAPYTTTPSAGAAGIDDYKIDDYKIGDYKSPYDYAGVGGGGTTTTDADDENRKDNLGLGEKEQRDSTKTPTAGDTTIAAGRSPTTAAGDLGKSEYNSNGGGYGGASAGAQQQPVGGVAGSDANMAGDGSAGPAATDYTTDYNTDYTGYEGYDTSAYDQQQYGGTGGGNADQYGNAGQGGYDTSGGVGQGGYDYSAGDYDQSAYQYDTPSSASVTPAAPTIAGVGGGSSDHRSPSSPPQPAPAAAAAPSPSASANGSGFATNPAGRAAAEGRPQPRAGGGAVGPAGAGGALVGGKSNMPQQFASAAAKK